MRQLHPRAVWLFFIHSLMVWFFSFPTIIILLLYFIVGSNEAVTQKLLTWRDFWNYSWPVIISGILLVLAYIIFLYVWARLSYHFYRYELSENGFRKELGVIYKTYVTIPYDRIQNVDIYRGILARLLGLSDLHIQTAGGTSVGRFAEGNLPGLGKEEAEKLREELIQRAKATKNQGL